LFNGLQTSHQPHELFREFRLWARQDVFVESIDHTTYGVCYEVTVLMEKVTPVCTPIHPPSTSMRAPGGIKNVL
jgi:hypothetical protein